MKVATHDLLARCCFEYAVVQVVRRVGIDFTFVDEELATFESFKVRLACKVDAPFMLLDG